MSRFPNTLNRSKKVEPKTFFKGEVPLSCRNLEDGGEISDLLKLSSYKPSETCMEKFVFFDVNPKFNHLGGS